MRREKIKVCMNKHSSGITEEINCLIWGAYWIILLPLFFFNFLLVIKKLLKLFCLIVPSSFSVCVLVFDCARVQSRNDYVYEGEWELHERYFIYSICYHGMITQIKKLACCHILEIPRAFSHSSWVSYFYQVPHLMECHSLSPPFGFMSPNICSLLQSYSKRIVDKINLVY